MRIMIFNHFSNYSNIFFELFGIEHIKHFNELFDVILNMGIIYHHRNPIVILHNFSLISLRFPFLYFFDFSSISHRDLISHQHSIYYRFLIRGIRFLINFSSGFDSIGTRFLIRIQFSSSINRHSISHRDSISPAAFDLLSMSHRDSISYRFLIGV